MGPRQLDKADFDGWRTLSTTRKFRQFLRDCAQSVRDEWAAGESWTEDKKTFVEVLDMIEGLTFDEIADFYAMQEDEGAEEGTDDAQE